MNRSPKVLLFLLLFSQLSCQKVVDLHLKNADKRYVVEGNITDQPGPYTVTLSRTYPFASSYTFDGVAGARVEISDDNGDSETLQEIEPGIYETGRLTGRIGSTYFLRIAIDDKVFTASSTMPQKVSFDSLAIRSVSNYDKIVLAAIPLFTDPKGQGNSYRFNQYINGQLDKTLYYQNDDFTDGQSSTWPMLRPDPDSTLKSLDKVTVDMQCIDQAMYKYWYSTDQSSTGNGGNIPSNPVTNLEGGALGYFSAHTSQTRTVVVK